MLTLLDYRDIALGIGIFLGGTLGDAVFHGMRSPRTAEEDKP